jgi:hypothetical protein
MKRHGFQLVEVLVALALVAGPLLIAATAVRSNGNHLALLEERVTARLLLFDLMDLLAMRDVAGLREATKMEWVEEFVRARLKRLPASYSAGYDTRVRELAKRCKLTVVEGAPGLRELVRVTLCVVLSNGTAVTLHRLARFPELSGEASP